jgi:hypothetical protein
MHSRFQQPLDKRWREKANADYEKRARIPGISLNFTLSINDLNDRSRFLNRCAPIDIRMNNKTLMHLARNAIYARILGRGSGPPAELNSGRLSDASTAVDRKKKEKESDRRLSVQRKPWN